VRTPESGGSEGCFRGAEDGGMLTAWLYHYHCSLSLARDRNHSAILVQRRWVERGRGRGARWVRLALVPGLNWRYRGGGGSGVAGGMVAAGRLRRCATEPRSPGPWRAAPAGPLEPSRAGPDRAAPGWRRRARPHPELGKGTEYGSTPSSAAAGYFGPFVLSRISSYGNQNSVCVECAFIARCQMRITLAEINTR